MLSFISAKSKALRNIFHECVYCYDEKEDNSYVLGEI